MLKKICGFLSTVLLIILLLIAGVLVLPPLLGCKNMAVLSGSMEPKIKVGAMVVARETEPEVLQVGDVITYNLAGDTLVTHRIIEINEAEGHVLTQGDANDIPDGAPVPYDRIVGKVLFHVPLLGYVTMYMKTPIGIAGICGLLMVMIVLNFLPDVLAKEPEKESM